jgi:hypothetical protein
MSRIDSLSQIRVRLTHVTTQVTPTSLERIRQAWAEVPMLKQVLQVHQLLLFPAVGQTFWRWVVKHA